jgi:N4-gp56 family major capsid protein
MVRQKGKLANQKAAVSFREHARDRLAYWLSNRIDQLALLTLSGVSYAYNLDGSTRADPTFQELAFAAEVSAPTTNRHVRVTCDANSVYTGLAAGATASVDATDILSYEALVDLNVYAKNQYVRPIRAGGKEYYIMLVRPEALAQLKKDANFQRAIVTGMERGASNPYFSGGTVTVDGIVIHEHRYVYNTKGADSGSKWGGGGLVDGARALLLGGQALAFADLGAPEWSEKWFQYDSSPGINVDKMFGFVKPVFYAQQTGTNEDFGVIAVDHHI